MTHLGYLFAAYTIVIVGLVLYVRRMVVRLGEVDEELKDLRRRIGGVDRGR